MFFFLLPQFSYGITNSDINEIYTSHEVIQGLLPKVFNIGDQIYIIYTELGEEGQVILGKMNNGSFERIHKFGVDDSANISYSRKDMIVYQDQIFLFYTLYEYKKPSMYSNIKTGVLDEDGLKIHNFTHPSLNLTNPQTVIYQEKLYLFFAQKATDFSQVDGSLLYTIYDGISWTEPQMMEVDNIRPGKTTPIILNDELYVFFHAFVVDIGWSVWLTKHDEGTWSEAEIFAHTQTTPRIISDENKIHIFWRNPFERSIQSISYDGKEKSQMHTVFEYKYLFDVENINGTIYLITIPSLLPKYTYFDFESHAFSEVGVESIESITLSGSVSNIDIISYDDKIWIFYDDGEYIRYITFDGEEFDYAGIVEPDPWIIQAMDAIVRHWWILLLGGITAVLLWTRISKHKREPKKETPFDQEADAEELSEFLSRRKEKE